MDIFANLWFGFGVAVTPTNLGLCLIGALVGTLIGVLPGIGPLATIAMLLMGLLLSAVGSDIETGQSRMAFDIPELADGIGFVVVAMGVFGYAEIMRNLETTESRDIVQGKITGLMPTMKDLKDSAGAI